MREGKNNILSGVVIITLGTLGLFETNKALYMVSDDSLGTGPYFFPKILMVIFISMGAMTILKGIKNNGDYIKKINWKPLTYIVILVASLFLSVSSIGFLIPSVPFLMASMWVMGFRRKILISFISVFFSLLIWFLCNFVFEIILPTSSWFNYI